VPCATLPQTTYSHSTCILPPANGSFIPPACPDNCTGNGKCTNLTDCDKLNKNDNAFNCDQSNIATVKSFNQTVVCACKKDFGGLNCANANGFNSAVLASVAVIVGPVVAGAALIALLVIAGGGAAAAAKYTKEDDEGNVSISPLYKPAVETNVGLS